jgi:hypothetical protein
MWKKPVFGSYDLDTYRRWRPTKVFGRYLSMKSNEEELHLQDRLELEKVEDFLRNMPFPDKVRLYNQIGGKAKETYRPFLVPKFEV